MSTIAQPVVYSDTLPIPRIKARSAILVVGFALLTALAAQIEISLGFTPVPLTLQTLAVVVAGATLGSRLGAMSIGLYMLAGLVLPFYAGGEKGWEYATGATGGYLVGMIVAAYLVGLLAERRQDRSVLTSIPAMLFGSAVVYAFGAPWLAHIADLSAVQAVEKGIEPFVVGDFVKSIVAGGLMPLAWKITDRK